MSAMRSALQGQTTRREVRRNEKKGERGVCRIQKRCEGSQGYETVGSGILIKHQIDPQWSSKYFIVTTSEVFQEDFGVTKYRVDFVKSRSKLKTFELDGAVVGKDILQNSFGLAVIPLDSHSSVFRHGLFRKKCEILKHRPFEVESFNNEKIKHSSFSDGLCCHMVADDSRSDLFGVKPHNLTRDSSSGQYVVSSLQSSHVPLGAGILRRLGNKWSAVGVLISSTSDSFVPVWLSEENFLKERFSSSRTGEAAIGTCQVDAVVYSEPSNTVGSLQTPPVDSVASPTSAGNQNGGGENSTIVDESTNGLNVCQGEAAITTNQVDAVVHSEPSNTVESQQAPPVDCAASPIVDGNQNGGGENFTVLNQSTSGLHVGQEPSRDVMNNQHSRREEEQNEPNMSDGRDLNGDIVQAGASGKFRNEANNGQEEERMKKEEEEKKRKEEEEKKRKEEDEKKKNEEEEKKKRKEEEEKKEEEEEEKKKEEEEKKKNKEEEEKKERKEEEEKKKKQEEEKKKKVEEEKKKKQEEEKKKKVEEEKKKKVEEEKKKKKVEEEKKKKVEEEKKKKVEEEKKNVEEEKKKKEEEGKKKDEEEKKKKEEEERKKDEEEKKKKEEKKKNKKEEGWKKKEEEEKKEEDARIKKEQEKREETGRPPGNRNEAVPSGEQFVSPKSTPNEKPQKAEAKSYQTGSDEVDNGLHSHPAPEISSSKSQQESRLMTAVTAIPYRVYAKICVKLNIRRLLFDDFRMLGEKVGLTRDEVEYLGQQENPTDHILKQWSATGQATVKKLMDVLSEEGLERNDVIEILKGWVYQ